MDAMHTRVWAQYPGAERHGSYAHWHWTYGEEIVAEAWLPGRVKSTAYWFLRVREQKGSTP